MRAFRISVLPETFLIATILTVFSSSASGQDSLPPLTDVMVTSSIDGSQQPVLYWAPPRASERPTTLFVFLHSWSSDYRQDNSKWQKAAVEQGWIYLHPNFRGANNSPPACGSKLARQDVLDAVDFALNKFQVDRSRVYLAGVSGGGHMSLLMAGHHPDRFSAVSAWVGISDLTRWHAFHVKDRQPQKYAMMIEACLTAPPTTNADVDADYRDRSPIHHLHRVGNLPVDIFAGVNDGHSGSVPVWHSLAAFNEIAKTHQTPVISEDERRELWMNRKLSKPQPSDKDTDNVLGREIQLRRTSKGSRVTIFEGGHESIPAAAIDWLKRQKRLTP